MKLKGSFEQLEPGIYGAVCTRVIDLGTQPGYKPTDTPGRQLLLGFEVEKFMTDGRPFYTMFTAFPGLGKKDKPTKLCSFLEGMRGKKFDDVERQGFDVKRVLGVPCEIVIGLSSGGKSKPTNASRPRIPVTLKPEKLVYFSLEPEDFNVEAFDDLSNWEKGKVQTSPEWTALQNSQEHKPADGKLPTDEVPF